MRVVLVVACSLAHSVAAAPAPRPASVAKFTHAQITSTDPAIVEAERLWRVAEHETDPARALAAWDAAAEALATIVEAHQLAPPILDQAALAGLAAAKNALALDPPPVEQHAASATLTVREQRWLRIVDAYTRVLPDADGAISAAYLKGALLVRHERLDEALPGLIAIIDRHPEHETSEYAAQLALDALDRLHDEGALLALAEHIRTTPLLVANRDELARTVDAIHTTAARKAVEAIERDADERHDLAAYDRCGTGYLAAFDDTAAVRPVPRGEHGSERGDELLYSALVCFARAGSLDRAHDAARRLAAAFPSSRLVPRGLAKLVVLDRDTGRFADAARDAEQLATRAPNIADALDALESAITWRLGDNDLAAAERDVDLLAKRVGEKQPGRVRLATAQLVDGLAAAGHRERAAARARDLARHLQSGSAHLPASARLALATTLAELACPVATIDGRCAQKRDAKLAAAARSLAHELAASSPKGATANANATAVATATTTVATATTIATATAATTMATATDLERDRARLIELDLAVPDFDNHLVLRAYGELTAPIHDVAIRVAARARLAQLATDREEAIAQARTCIADASATIGAPSPAGLEWIPACDHVLHAHGGPRAEVRAHPRATAEPALEPPAF